MKKIKFKLAVSATKIIYSLLNIGRVGKGTSLPGKIAMKICPEVFAGCINSIKDKIFTITGTNGKTTTAGLLASILREDEKRVIHNEKGANMPAGIATALILECDKGADNAVLEVDEAYLASLYKQIEADCLLVTNFFRDQLDRYGELDTTQKKVKEAISLNPDLQLILNADDPLVYALKRRKNTLFYGIENVEYINCLKDSNSPSEAINCKCNKVLNYKKRFYAHLGHWSCVCSNLRPKPDVCANVKLFSTHSFLDVSYKDKNYLIKLNLSGLYNAYNALGAISTALWANIPLRTIAKAVENYKSVFGRSETFCVNEKKVTVQLIKNPTGASEVLKTVNNLDSTDLLIAINDDYADGRDVSWLWDADFELLENFNGHIYISGSRAYDMALRLKYAGFKTDKMIIVLELKKAYKMAINSKSKNLIIFPTYTALLKLQGIIRN